MALMKKHQMGITEFAEKRKDPSNQNDILKTHG